jgi:predicted lipoprotein with Yx(FWY)xxD motif
VAAVAIVVFGVAAAVAPASIVTVTSAQNTALGKILVSSSGKTLYHYSGEKKNSVKCTGSCAAQWPPLVVTASAKPAAGPGVTASLLGTIKRPDGKTQVTYKGLPLYTYSGDRKAGDVKGQGSSGIWHALAPSGAVVTKTATTSSSTSGSGSSSTSGSGSTSSNTGTGSSKPSGSGGAGYADCTADPGNVNCM